MLRECADGDVVDACPGERAQVVSRDITGDLQSRPALVQRDGPFQVAMCKVVQQDTHGAGFEGFGKFIERLDLDLDPDVREAFDRLLQYLCDRAGGADVVFLDQHGIVETDTVIGAAATQHGVLLGQAQTRNGLASIQDAHARALYFLDIAFDDRCCAGQRLQKVERGTFGCQQGTRTAADLAQSAVGRDRVAVLPEPVDSGFGIDLAKDLVKPGRATEDAILACDDHGLRRELFVESPIPNPTVMFRRETLRKLNGYREPEWPEDYDLFLRADACGMRMGKPDGTLLRWRDHEGRLTRTDARYAVKSFQAAKAHFLARYRLRASGPVVIWGAGPTGRSMHDLLRGEGVEVSGFLDVHPRRVGGHKRGLPVWPVGHADRLAGVFLLVAVGAAGAREKIRDFMWARHRLEGADYLFVA